jgi:DNA gyrase subunit A
VVIGLDPGDSLLAAFPTTDKGEVILVTAQGQGIRFAEEEVRPMGLPAGGVMGVKLARGDTVVGAGPIKPRGDVVIVTRQGLGKRTGLDQFPKQGRHGQGVIAMPLTKDSGPVVTAATVNSGDRVMLVSVKGNNKTVYAKSLSKFNRNQKGEELIAIRGRDGVAQVVTLPQ